MALIGRAHEGLCNVEFLIDRDDFRNARIVRDALRELNFYLGELKQPNAWVYLQYHCSTMSNVYSTLHWDYVPASFSEPHKGKRSNRRRA